MRTQFFDWSENFVRMECLFGVLNSRFVKRLNESGVWLRLAASCWWYEGLHTGDNRGDMKGSEGLSCILLLFSLLLLILCQHRAHPSSWRLTNYFRRVRKKKQLRFNFQTNSNELDLKTTHLNMIITPKEMKILKYQSILKSSDEFS